MCVFCLFFAFHSSFLRISVFAVICQSNCPLIIFDTFCSLYTHFCLLTFQVIPFTTLTYNFLDHLIISNAAFYNRSDCYVFMLSPRCVYVLSLPLCYVLDLT